MSVINYLAPLDQENNYKTLSTDCMKAAIAAGYDEKNVVSISYHEKNNNSIHVLNKITEKSVEIQIKRLIPFTALCPFSTMSPNSQLSPQQNRQVSNQENSYKLTNDIFVTADLISNPNNCEKSKLKHSEPTEHDSNAKSCFSSQGSASNTSQSLRNNGCPQSFRAYSNQRFPSTSFHCRKRRCKTQNRSPDIPRSHMKNDTNPEGAVEMLLSSELTSLQREGSVLHIKEPKREKYQYERDDLHESFNNNCIDRIADKSDQNDMQFKQHDCRYKNSGEIHSSHRNDSKALNETLLSSPNTNYSNKFSQSNALFTKLKRAPTKTTTSSQKTLYGNCARYIFPEKKIFPLLLSMCFLLSVCVPSSSSEVVPCPFNKMCKCRFTPPADDVPRTRIPVPLEVICVGVPFATIPSEYRIHHQRP